MPISLCQKLRRELLISKRIKSPEIAVIIKAKRRIKFQKKRKVRRLRNFNFFPKLVLMTKYQ
jgi:hypothetical protein